MHLADYMRLKELSDDDVARRVGVSRPTISRIRRRLSRPDWMLIMSLKKMSRGQITADDFTELVKETG